MKTIQFSGEFCCVSRPLRSSETWRAATIETEFVLEWRANFLESGLLHAAIVVEMDVKLMRKGPASLPDLSFSFER